MKTMNDSGHKWSLAKMSRSKGQKKGKDTEMTTGLETVEVENAVLEDEADTSLDGLTPKEYYKKTGTAPEGYKVAADGKLRRTTREKKSGNDDFHKAAKAF